MGVVWSQQQKTLRESMIHRQESTKQTSRINEMYLNLGSGGEPQIQDPRPKYLSLKQLQPADGNPDRIPSSSFETAAH